jgi:hypothetical protein
MPILGTIASSLRAGAAETYEVITSQTLGSNQTTVTFNSISQAYTDLVIRASWRTSRNAIGWDDVKININGSSAADYIGRLRWGSNAADNQQSESATYFVARPYLSYSVAPDNNLYTNSEFYIQNYSSSSQYKTIHGADGVSYFTSASSSGVFLNGYVYTNTSAVTSLSMTQFSNPQTADIAAGSIITLYGIKKA